MRVIHVTSWLSSAGGGVSAVVEALSRATERQKIETRVYGLEDHLWPIEKNDWRGAHAETFPVIGPRALGFSPALRRALTDANPDVAHTHGLWMHPSAAVASWSGGRKPYVVSPHGMLDAWAVANSNLRKRIARFLYEDRHLRAAACIHALCQAEACAVRALGLDNPICVIPNGVDIPTAIEHPAPPWPVECPGARVLLFLGRLHPKKNILGLLRAIAAVKAQNRLGTWRLVIAGWDQRAHSAELVACQAELGLQAEVVFLGPVWGAKKMAAFRNADAFVLPSVSEGLPMAVLEAWSYGLPVAMTAACNLTESFGFGAAHELAAGSDGMARSLSEFLALDERALTTMGGRGRKLVESRFGWELSAERFCMVYAWLIGAADKPDCVDPGAHDSLRRT